MSEARIAAESARFWSYLSEKAKEEREEAHREALFARLKAEAAPGKAALRLARIAMVGTLA
jgi:hypothetical protein